MNIKDVQKAQELFKEGRAIEEKIQEINGLITTLNKGETELNFSLFLKNKNEKSEDEGLEDRYDNIMNNFFISFSTPKPVENKQNVLDFNDVIDDEMKIIILHFIISCFKDKQKYIQKKLVNIGVEMQ